jgi:hypothetical protein
LCQKRIAESLHFIIAANRSLHMIFGCFVPPLLPLGERFETLQDARRYSLDSEYKLDLSTPQQDQLSNHLYECRTLAQRCDQPYCSLCARPFRIWFIGELLRIIENIGSGPVYILTILLEEASYDEICRLDVKGYDAELRKRLSRNGLGAPVSSQRKNVRMYENSCFPWPHRGFGKG